MSRPINKSKGDHCTACGGTGLAPKQRQPKSRELPSPSREESTRDYGSTRSTPRNSIIMTKLKEDVERTRASKTSRSKNRKGYK